jgi:hypothetical protein
VLGRKRTWNVTLETLRDLIVTDGMNGPKSSKMVMIGRLGSRSKTYNSPSSVNLILKEWTNAMSAISPIGRSTPILGQPIQTTPSKQPAKVATTAPSQAAKPAGNDPDHDGDSDGGGIDVAG